MARLDRSEMLCRVICLSRLQVDDDPRRPTVQNVRSKPINGPYGATYFSHGVIEIGIIQDHLDIDSLGTT